MYGAYVTHRNWGKLLSSWTHLLCFVGSLRLSSRCFKRFAKNKSTVKKIKILKIVFFFLSTQSKFHELKLQVIFVRNSLLWIQIVFDRKTKLKQISFFLISCLHTKFRSKILMMAHQWATKTTSSMIITNNGKILFSGNNFYHNE